MIASCLERLRSRICYISPIGMLTMSTADKTSTIRALFSEIGSAGKDTNNVNNIEYATRIQTIQAGNRIRDHPY